MTDTIQMEKIINEILKIIPNSINYLEFKNKLEKIFEYNKIENIKIEKLNIIGKKLDDKTNFRGFLRNGRLC